MANSSPLRASAALAAYAESLIQGSRVLVFGDAHSGLCELLVERGARLVHLYDPDTTRVAEAATRNTSRNVSFAPLADGALAVRDGAFELVIIENLPVLGSPSAIVQKAKRALAPRGALLATAPNNDVSQRLLPEEMGAPLDYYEFYDLLSSEFAEVQVAAMAPFVGYAVAQFGDPDPTPTFDSTLVPGGVEEAEWFLAVASQQELAVESFTLVQLPWTEALGSRRGADTDRRLRQVRDSEQHWRQRAQELDQELRALRDSDDSSRQQTEAATAELRTELQRREDWIRQLEARAVAADARADVACEQLDDLEQRAASAERERDEARRSATNSETTLAQLRAAAERQAKAPPVQDDRALREARAEGTRLTTELREEQRRAEQLTAETRDLRRELDRARATEKALESSRDEMERLRRELDQARQELESQRRQEQRVSRELAEAVQRLAQLKQQRDERQQQLAKQVEELQSAQTSDQERDAAATAELEALEEQLRERGRYVRHLEEELRQALRAGHALLAKLTDDEGEGELAPVALRARLDELAGRNAQLEADLTSAQWTLEQLRSLQPIDDA